jgi:hypothetical protein
MTVEEIKKKKLFETQLLLCVLLRCYCASILIYGKCFMALNLQKQYIVFDTL